MTGDEAPSGDELAAWVAGHLAVAVKRYRQREHGRHVPAAALARIERALLEVHQGAGDGIAWPLSPLLARIGFSESSGVVLSRPESSIDEAGAGMGDAAEVDTLLRTREQAAELLGLSVSSVDRLIASGDLPAQRVRRRVLVHRDDLNTYAAGGDSNPAA